MLNSKRILLVEDDDLLRNVYLEVLTSEDYQVDHARDGNEAWEKISEGGYDLILLDVILPFRNAFEILQALQKTPSKKENGKVLLMTNLSEESTSKEAVKYGVADVLTKSDLTPEEFLNKVKEFI